MSATPRLASTRVRVVRNVFVLVVVFVVVVFVDVVGCDRVDEGDVGGHERVGVVFFRRADDDG